MAVANNRILFVCGEYYPYPSANGVCVTRLQEAFLSIGFASDVICLGDMGGKELPSDFGMIRFVSSSAVISTNPIGKAYRKLKILGTWPVKAPDLVDQYVAAIQSMNERFHYDLIVSVLRPIEGALACSRIDNFVLYELDSITNNFDNLHGVKRLLSYRAYKIEAEIYNRAMKVFHLKCHTDFYSASRYNKVRDKFVFTDIPHLVIREKQETVSTINDVTRIIFTGAIVKERNSPEYAIKLIEQLADEMKIRCDFYSRGNCEELIKEKSIECPDIFRRMGYVPQEELKAAIQTADMFLSIGSHFTNSVTSIPSKVIEYMSSGKPIIHFLGTNDTAVPYLEKYGNVVFIDENDSDAVNLEKIMGFINNNKNNLVDVEKLRTRLPMNTPEWTVKRMIEAMNGKE